MGGPSRSRGGCTRWVVATGIILVVFGLAGPARSQPAPMSDSEIQAQVVFREVMSPFCPGLTLGDCPSPQAFELRGEITRRLQAGESRQAIVDGLVATYGPGILSDPSGTPIGRVIWGVPILLSLVAAGALALFLRRITRVARDLPPPPVSTLQDASTRLEEELSALE